MYSLVKGLKYFAAGFCMALVVAIRSFSADGLTKVEGVIKHDAVWSGSVLVEGDVLVPAGVTLTIVPGTSVTFMPSDSTKIEPMFLSMQTELLVRGRLVAEGVKDAPISFGPAIEALSGKKPERGDWGGIIFDGPGSSTSVLSNANVSKADTGVTVYAASPPVTDCTVEDCRYGVVSMGGGGARLSGTTVTGCEFGVVAAMGAQPSVSGSKIGKNEHDLLLRN